MNNSKRHLWRVSLALMMSVLMVVSILPMNVFAADPADATTTEAKADNQTYKAAASKTRVPYKKGTVGDAKLAIDKDNLAKLPAETKFEWVDKTIFEGVGDKLAEIKVTFPDGTTEIIKAPISISNAYEIDGEKYSGNFYSDEKNAKTTSNPDLNIGFQMDSLESDAARAKNELRMDMSALYSGGQTTKGRDKMDAYLELDDRLAKYVDRIEGSREDSTGESHQYVWERVRNYRGELTNTWKRKAFSTGAEPGKNATKTVFIGDRPEVTRKNKSNTIIFKEAIKEIIDKEVPNVENGDLIYRFFIADENMTIQNQSVDDGYITVGKEQAKDHPDATATNNINWFANSHSVLNYQPDAGTDGGFTFDHILVKSSDGGTLNNYRDMQNREFAYRFQIDPRLLPYIDSVEAHMIDGSLTQGFNFNAYNSEREHSKYQAAAPQGYLGRGREGWVGYEMRFNNGGNTTSQYTASPEGAPQEGKSGSMGPIAWYDTRNEGTNDKASYRYKVLKDGEGYFTLDNAPINFNSEQVWFSPGTTQDAVVRLVLKFKKGVDLNQVLTANGGKDTNYGVSGYFVNSKDELIPHSNTTGHIRVTDIDNDGIADDVDDNIQLPPTEETDNEKYTPEGQDVETIVGVVPKAEDGIKSVKDKDGKDASDKVESYHWEKAPDVSKAGEEKNAVIVTYEDGTSERVPVKITVKDGQASTLEPKYEDADGKVGEEATVEAPKFLDEKSTADPKPEADPQPTGMTFALGDGYTGTAKIDDESGEITYTPVEADKDKTVEIPVVVTYSDGSTDEVVAKINVTKVSDTEVIPYEPKDKEKPTDPDDENIPTEDKNGKIDKSQYNIIAFKTEDIAKGKLELGELKDKEVISVLVKKGSKWEKVTAPTPKPVDKTVKFLSWDPTLPEATVDVENGKVYTAKFVKDGEEIKPGTDLPEGVFEVKVLRDETSIKDNALYGKSYAVFENSKLAQDKFPTPEAEENFKNPAWNVEKPWDQAITANTDFKASAVSSAFDKDKITKIEFTKDPTKMTYTEGDKPEHAGLEITLTDENGNTQVVTKDKLEEYGITVTPAETTDLAKDNDGNHFVAKVNNKDGEEITANSPGTITVNDKPVEKSTPTNDFEQGYNTAPEEDEEGNPIGDGKPTVEVTIPEGVEPGTTIKVVKEKEDGTTEVVGETTVPEDHDGKVTITLDDDKTEDEDVIKVVTEEPGKKPTESDNSITLDKKGPEFTHDGEDGDTVVGVLIEEEAYGHEIRITTTAEDDNGVLKIYYEGQDGHLYYLEDAKENKVNLRELIKKAEITEDKIKLVAIDKFGNRGEFEAELNKKLEILDIKAERPYNGDDFLEVSTKEGASVLVTIMRAGAELYTKTITATGQFDEIALYEDGIVLEKGDIVTYEATLSTAVGKMTQVVR